MQKLQLSIPEPCHENWQQMMPTEQGRFCNACAKEVIDFSTMTDIQVLNYFTNLTHENICGRALPEQLDRAISRPEQLKKRLFWYWNYVVIFFIFFTKGNNAAAQSCTKPATELTPVNNANLRGEMIVVDELKINGSRIITGKITDKDGNPVSFASIRIKGANTGVSADTNGAYSIKAQPNSILIISGAGFAEAEISLGMQTKMNSVLEKMAMGGLLIFRNSDDYYGPEDKFNYVAVLAVKDETSGKAIQKATIVITKNSIPDSVLTDKKGVYKLKGIKKYEEYFIKVIADGYEANEFTIAAGDFKDRKKEWEVLLRKEEPKEKRQTDINNALAGKVGGIQVGSQSGAKLSRGTNIIVGGVVAIDTSNNLIYVVDGIIMPATDRNTDDIEDVSLLQGPAAAALFGYEGRNGAMVITTKKQKVKNLDTVTVTAFSSRVVGRLVTTSMTTVMGATVKGVTVKSSIADSLRIIANKFTGAIKVYPNPVQHGITFNVALKLKQAGFYQLQIIDAAGRIVLQKQISADTKEHTEKIIADSRWSGGVYYVGIIDNKNKLITKASFIIQ